MKSTGESPSPSETSNGRAIESNCVAEKRGGEQLEMDPQTQTQVNPIRPMTTASLLASGEACCLNGSDRRAPHSSYYEKRWVVEGGWGEYAGKVSCLSRESPADRTTRKRGCWAVRAAIVVMKPGNSGGAKGGRKEERQRK